MSTVEPARPDAVVIEGAYFRPGSVGYEIAWQMTKWEARAKAAEATLARVSALNDDLDARGVDGPDDSPTDRDHRYGIREASRRLRAALTTQVTT